MTHPKPPNFPLSERKGFLEKPASRRKDWSGRRDLNSGPPAPRAGTPLKITFHFQRCC